uniref:DUF5824 domain-containing protein n=1 Tax=viral metagenome TaxID=1070528 RepID=A0A6C0JJ25_9ZZZZ
MFLPKSIPIRYAPNSLNSKDKKSQLNMLMKSRRLYKKNKYFTRKSLPSFKNRKSSHINDAKKLYKLDSIVPGRELSKATGCSIPALKKIVNKGEGAYFSSGSRPNQTAQSWGRARLASSITGGKSAAVDFKIIEEGCNHNKKAYALARKTRKTYRFR